MEGFKAAHRLVLPQFLSSQECKELEFIHKSCGVVGYRPCVLSTTLSHLIATNCADLIVPILPVRERVKEAVEEHFGCEYELFTEFTGLISWTKGAKIGWHSDSNRPYLKQRHYSAVCYLNNYGQDFKGGLFHFQEGEPLRILPMAGTVVIYTADGKNMHCVDEVTDGERCTMALWFTLDSAHDEDKKLIKLLSTIASETSCATVSNQDLEDVQVKADQMEMMIKSNNGGINGFYSLHRRGSCVNVNQQCKITPEVNVRHPISASSLMYMSLNDHNHHAQSANKSVLEQSSSPPSAEISKSDLRIARMAFLGFRCLLVATTSGEQEDQPVELLYKLKKVPHIFSSVLHAVQVVQFHQYRTSESQGESLSNIQKLSGSAPGIFTSAKCDTNHSIVGKHFASLDAGCEQQSLSPAGESCYRSETDELEFESFLYSLQCWQMYTCNLWKKVSLFLPAWRETSSLGNYDSAV